MIKIGVFDSGVGGVGVLQKLHSKLSPNAVQFLYLADQKNAPFGQKSIDEISKINENIFKFFIEQKVDILVIACNTSAAFLSTKPSRFKTSFPVFCPIIHTAKKVSKITKTNQIAILATTATVNNGAFASEIKTAISKHNSSLNKTIKVHQIKCPKLVPLIEAGEFSKIHGALNEYLEEFLAKNTIDTLVLGCTHYSVIKNEVLKIIEQYNIELIDSVEEISASVLEKLKKFNKIENSINSLSDYSNVSFLTTGPVIILENQLKSIFCIETENIKEVKID